MEEAIITITIKKSEGQWFSEHQFTNIDDLMAAVVLFDVGRNLILRYRHVHDHDHDHHHHPEAGHGDAATEN